MYNIEHKTHDKYKQNTEHNIKNKRDQQREPHHKPPIIYLFLSGIALLFYRPKVER